MTANHPFKRRERLRRPSEFERVYALKFKAADGVLLLVMAPNETGRTRIGLSVSKKHGGAVVRNRLKRWLREAFRLERPNMPVGYDLIAIPLAKDRATLDAYRTSLSGLVRRLVRRRERAEEAPR